MPNAPFVREKPDDLDRRPSKAKCGYREAISLPRPTVAAILPVVGSCRRLRVPVRAYFSAILPGLADLPIRCLPDLTPAVRVGRHS